MLSNNSPGFDRIINAESALSSLSDEARFFNSVYSNPTASPMADFRSDSKYNQRKRMNLQRVTFSGSSKGRFMQISAACFHCEDTTNYLNSFIVLFSIAVPLSTASAYAASSSPNYFNVYSIILTISSFFSALSLKNDDLFNISFSIFIKLSIYDRSGTLRSIEIFSSVLFFPSIRFMPLV